jgi:hypothetical protein
VLLGAGLPFVAPVFRPAGFPFLRIALLAPEIQSVTS